MSSECLAYLLHVPVISMKNAMRLTELGERITAWLGARPLVAQYASDQFDAFMEGSCPDQFARASVHADLNQQWSDRIEACADEFDVHRDDVLDVLHVVLRDEISSRAQPA